MKKIRFLSFLLLLLLLFPSCNGFLVGAPEGTAPVADPPATPNGTLAVHFIDVGQADSILVLCEGKAMLIDGGNAEDSNLIYTYLKKQGVTHLDYVVCTHAHEDHVGGLSGALTYATVSNVLSPVKEYNSKAFSNFMAKARERGAEPRIPEAGEVLSLGSARVTVVGPLKQYDDPNNTSIVLRLVYGETSFLFTGDMETAAETDLLESGAELRSTVLKLGHHGSSTSTSYRFLRAVAPTYGVIQVGTGNSYGHPNEEVLSRLRDAEVTLYRTDLQGDVICIGDGKTVSFTTAKGSDAVTNPTGTSAAGTGAAEYAYVGNLSSKKFHALTCTYLPAESNRIYFITREEAVAASFVPCGVCKP